MNKHVNFEDNLFILNANISMIRDMLRLEPDSGLFLEKTVADMEFIDRTLESLTGNLIANIRLLNRELEFDNVSDIEWQFGQILNEFMGEDGPFPVEALTEIRSRIRPLQDRSAARRKAIDQNAVPADQTPMEPVVSSLELSELLQKF
jgi:hypothetical protein